MKRNRLGRLYDHLTLEERFRLDVLALARGDKEESERLTDTCPRRNYTMNDWEFVGRWQAAQELAMLTYMELAKCLDKCQMIAAFRVALPYLHTVWVNDTHQAYFDGHHAGSHHAWRKAGKEGEPPGWEGDDEKAERNADPGLEEALDKWTGQVKAIDDRLSKNLEALERGLVEEGLAVWSAFSGFCREEMGLDSKKLLAAFADPFAEKAGELENLAARLEVKPDPESVEEYRDILFEAWHRVLKKG
jgi:hypothetical protein